MPRRPARNRAVYAVVGSSGKVSGGPLDHPVMFTSLNQLGSLVLDVDGDRLDAKFLRDDGVVADSFTIVKTPAKTHPRRRASRAPAAGTPQPTSRRRRARCSPGPMSKTSDRPGVEKQFRATRRDSRSSARRTAGGSLQIATVGAGVTRYSSTGLAADKTYFYRVRATNGSGRLGVLEYRHMRRRRTPQHR